VVLTHGLRVRPFSTAFFASSAAATMTYGFEVLVQEVMAAIVTAPWSSSYVEPSGAVTGDRVARYTVAGGRGVGGREGLLARLVVVGDVVARRRS
jgi:hypothetical protein